MENRSVSGICAHRGEVKSVSCFNPQSLEVNKAKEDIAEPSITADSELTWATQDERETVV